MTLNILAPMNLKKKTRNLMSATVALTVLLGITKLSAQVVPATPAHPPATLADIGSLKTAKIPEVPGLTNEYIKDLQTAIRLGKALFWEQRAGSDGMACASCHYTAGADNRIKNQISPGLLGGNGSFDFTASGGKGPGHTLKPEDFPFIKFSDVNDRHSTIQFETDDVSSSAGVFNANFVSVVRGGAETVTKLPDALFNIGGKATRRVEPRNTPTVINATFQHRQFWDGRANNTFNGVNPFGQRDTNAGIYVRRDDGSTEKVKIRIKNASLASQACGPPLSTMEMSAAGRSFPDIGKKLIITRALATQAVHTNDSVLGPYRHSSGLGLVETYESLIKAAFYPKFWSSPDVFMVGSTDYTHMEMNFSLFWGLAIMVYEQTLVSDDTPWDRYAEGDANALTPQQKHGLQVFVGPANCIACHAGPEFSKAATFLVAEFSEGMVERMRMGDGGVALYDNGFYNIGVRPTKEDLGAGNNDPWGQGLSFTRLYLDVLKGLPAFDNDIVDPCKFETRFDPNDCTIHPNPWLERTALDGAFKTSPLRNIELTGPYFHNGGYATLEQVVDFYNRGGNRQSINQTNDTSGFAGTGSNLDPDITDLGLTAEDKAALVAFMKALTDERVRWEKAPFDHPELRIPHGHANTDADNDGRADDQFLVLPAVGAQGRAAQGLPPVKGFLQ